MTLKKIMLLALTLLAAALPAKAVKFTYEYMGSTLMYISGNNKTCTVTGYASLDPHLAIPDSVKYNNTVYEVTFIGVKAFYDCSELTELTRPNSLTSIGTSAFQGCSGLTSLSLPQVTTILSCALQGCSGLTSLTLPNSLTSIDYKAFDGCSGLTEVTLPYSLTSIGEYAFYGCRKLTVVKSCITEPFDISSSVFNPEASSATLRVPTGTKELYMAAKGWNAFNNIVEDESLGVKDVVADEVWEDGVPVTVYNLGGAIVRRGCFREEMMSLPGGIYIVKSGEKYTKLKL